MNVFQLKTLFHVFLVTAFLSMQCSGAHVHLAEHQDHGSNHHHHASQVHAHFVNDHGDSLYTPSVAVNSQVIDISQKWANPGWSKLDDSPTLVFAFNFVFQSAPQAQYTQSINTQDSQLAWLFFTTLRSRAPPTPTS